MIIVKHEGRKGNKGQDGSDGLGVDTQSGARISSPYFQPFRKNAIDKAVVWDRSTEAAFQNRYDLQEVIQSKESKQVINYTTVDEVNWLDPFGYDVWSVTATGVTDPFSGTGAVELTITDTTLPGRDFTLLSVPVGAEVGRIYRVSFYARITSGSITSCKGGVGNISSIPDGNIDISTLDTTWRRFTTIASAANVSEFNLYFETTGAVIEIYLINATSGTGIYQALPAVGNAPVTIETGSKVYRQSDQGFIIEPESTNLCLHSEDLRQWSVTGANVAINNNFDSFNIGGSYTRVNFTSAGTAVFIVDGLSLTSGVEYSVSFLFQLIDGSIASLGVSLGSGASVGADVSSTGRTAVKCTSGASNQITITATTSDSSTSFVLAGIQVEQREPTGYVPTIGTSRSRSYDAVSFDSGNLPSLSNPFSAHIAWSNVITDNTIKYIFNAGDSFYAYLVGNRVVIYGLGVELIDLSISVSEIFITFNGASIYLHSDSELLAESLYNGENEKPSFFYVGSSDNAGSDVLNGAIESLTFYDFQLTQDEMKYLGGR
jgi:hypothetical protein